MNIIDTIIRDVCETDRADPCSRDTVCIDVEDLRVIIANNLSPTQGADTIIAHPGERVSMSWAQYVALTGTQGADARPVATFEQLTLIALGWLLEASCNQADPRLAAIQLALKNYVEAQVDGALDAAPNDGISEEMLTQGVKALLNCTMGELECVSLKLLDSYEADVKRVYEAMLAAIAPRGKT